MQYISKQLIMDVCEAIERTSGARVGVRWWDQSEIELTGARETAELAIEADEDRMEENNPEMGHR